MPQSDGGYVSLGGGPNSIYNSTTEPQSGSKSVMETRSRQNRQISERQNAIRTSTHCRGSSPAWSDAG
uniref:Uncharacterized protein n=1 Tax=Anopheles culicifacies TaxID=139723 RepID=A0A182LU35_9DIPT